MTAKVPRIDVKCPVCGRSFEANPRRIAAGRDKHCSRSCSAKANSVRHGHNVQGKESRTYMSWATMIQRCTNPKATAYSYYGGSGILVCDKWRAFAGFLEDMGERPEGTTLDRIDGSGDYCKENCRWASRVEQQSNLKSNVTVAYNGLQMTRPELARQLGIDLSTLRWRMRNWPEGRWGEPAAVQGRAITNLRDRALSLPS